MKKVVFLIFSIYIIFNNIYCNTIEAFTVNYSTPSISDERYFDLIITEKALIPKTRQKKWISYYSIGESIKKIDNVTENIKNPSWNSFLIDNQNSDLIEHHKNSIRERLKDSDGIFLDNIDSYYNFEKPPFGKSITNISKILKSIKKEFPDKLIIINRGFEGLDSFASYIDGILIENLFNIYDFKKKKITPNKEAKQTLDIINNIKQRFPALNILLIEYFEKNTLENPYKIENIKYDFLNTKPYFSDIALDKTWILSSKIKNRFLVLHNEDNAWYSKVNKYLQIYFEYYGFILDYININREIPEDTEKYAGLIIWNSGEDDYYNNNIKNIIDLFFDRKIIYIGNLYEELMDCEVFNRIEYNTFIIEKDLKLKNKSEYTGFEFFPESYSVSSTITKHPYKDIAVTDSGSIGIMSSNLLLMIFDPLTQIGEDDFLWNINPFLLFEDFLKPDFPVPDICSVSGKRIGFSHLDADGFNSGNLIFPEKTCLEVMHEEIALKYPWINFSYSFITSFLEEKNEKKAGFLTDYIKNISSPSIEIASHSYSHPFFMLEGRENQEYGHNIKIEGYDKIDFNKEIVGSIKKLKQISDKTVNNYFLTGDCLPTESFLDIAQKNNIMTINGGDPIFDSEHNSYSYLKPGYTQVGKHKQIFAQSQNEFIFTNGWQENFYGFKSVTETFLNSGNPFLLKPVDLYFHFYVVERIAGLRSLENVLLEMEKMNLCYIFTSDYLDIINSYFDTSIEKIDKNTFYIKDTKVRSFKNFTGRNIDFLKSKNVIGKNLINNTEYIFTGNDKTTEIVFTHEIDKYYVILNECNKIVDSIDIDIKNKIIYLQTPAKYAHITLRAVFTIKDIMGENFKIYDNKQLINNLKKIGSGKYEVSEN